MDYVVTRRFRGTGIGGAFNLPYGTVCHLVGEYITAPDGRTVCTRTSENAYGYFRPNTEEGRRRAILLAGLYRYYERGPGDAADDFDPAKWPGAENLYWRHLLRTMPTDRLTAWYRDRLGEPNYKED